jgi:hypothetical protein
MSFEIKVAKFVLGTYQHHHLPEIAIAALREKIESESLLILAGMTDADPSYERQRYFEAGLEEINYTCPSRKEAGFILLKHYLKEMIENPDTAFDHMLKIQDEIYHPVFYTEK